VSTQGEKMTPQEIEARSMAIIARELGERVFPPEELPVVKRVIHTTADFDYADNLRFSPGAVAAGLAALREGCTLVTDTRMAWAGINKRALEKLHSRAACFIDDPQVAAVAAQRGETRSAVAAEWAAQLPGALILAVGNAPTALERICDLIDRGALKPRLVIGVPVGFVHVEESKRQLTRTEVPYIAAMGRKGGSNIAAAICNALIYAALGESRG
jgi:precorrin-8X/cobalt-precorrin-8 methylmutase